MLLKRRPPARESVAKYRERIHKAFFAKYDGLLDNDPRIQWLRQPHVATVIRDNLYHHHGDKYRLWAYCVMPNHVHVLLQPTSTDERTNPNRVFDPESQECLSDEFSDRLSPLSSIMHSLKSYTANRANVLLERSGQLWQHESYDHWVRDDAELERVAEYIAYNPVRAGFVSAPEQWTFSSYYDRWKRERTSSPLLWDWEST